MIDTKKEHPEALFKDEARIRMLEGVKMLSKAVRVTLGPKGKNVVIENKGGTHVLTKDGVTVAKAMNLRDPYCDMGCQLVKEVAQRTNDVAGDGTTTATVLAHALFENGMKLLAAKHSAVGLKRGIDAAVISVVEELKKNAIPIDDDEKIVNVATVSANGEREIGELLKTAFDHVGRDGVITVEEAKGLKTTLEVVDGARYNRGYLSSFFVTDPNRMVCELDDPMILITNMRFQTPHEIMTLLEKVNTSRRELLIIADEVEGELLKLLVTNHMRGTLKCCAIKAPAFGEQRVNMLNDIAIMTGGSLLSAGDKVDGTLVDSKLLGGSQRVIIDKMRVTFVGSKGDPKKKEERIDVIKEQLESPTLSFEDRGMLNDRLGKLAAGVAIIHVGGATELELKERKYRVEDALNATTSAMDEGIVSGGGIALLRATKQLIDLAEKTDDIDERLGIKLVAEACSAPLQSIVRNAGAEPVLIEAEIRKKIDESSFGYDAANGTYVDVMKAGIVDPVKVTRTALENAASVAGLLLTVDACVLDTVEKDPLTML